VLQILHFLGQLLNRGLVTMYVLLIGHVERMWLWGWKHFGTLGFASCQTM
jgi:hypothetical protein